MPSLSPSTDTASHSTTGSLIVKDALLILGVVDPTEDLDASDLSVGLRFLNRMMDAMNTEALMLYKKAAVSASSSSRQPTIGPGGTFDTVRPEKLEDGQVWLRSGVMDYPVYKMSQEEWALIEGMTWTGIPARFYYDKAFPLGTLNFDYTPDQSYTLIVYPWTLINQIVNASAVLTFPPGMTEVLVTHLALKLAPTYGQKATEDMVQNATLAKANWKRSNSEPVEVGCDAATLSPIPYGYVRDIKRGY